VVVVQQEANLETLQSLAALAASLLNGSTIERNT
jgi:hypothetical protein